MREVERWRGTPEMQAQRASVRKLGQFAYFDHQLNHPDWTHKRVLDFGGTDGNLLWNSDCAIRHENYYCLDVIRDAIEAGRRTFPRAHWIHYDHYNCSFNPDGVPGLPIPDLGTEFDVILAYSVFTHTTPANMHELVRQLRTRLAVRGVLAFTFEDVEGNLAPRLRRFRDRNRSVDVDSLLQRSRGASWCAVVTDEGNVPELFVDASGTWTDAQDHCINYDVYHTVDFMQREFPDAVIRPPVNGECQHCCVIRNR